jgi:hypothetical protein
MPRPRTVIAASVWAAIGAALTVVAAFSPWYETAIGPIDAPDTMSGWDGSWGRIAVAAAAISGLCSVIIAADIRGDIAVTGQTRRVLSTIALLGAVIALGAVGYRFVEPPDPALGVTRELGVFLALFACLVTLGAAIIQFGTARRDPSHPSPRRARRASDAPAPGPSR